MVDGFEPPVFGRGVKVDRRLVVTLPASDVVLGGRRRVVKQQRPRVVSCGAARRADLPLAERRRAVRTINHAAERQMALPGYMPLPRLANLSVCRICPVASFPTLYAWYWYTI